MLENILAKPITPENPKGETLAEHTDALIDFWRIFRERFKQTEGLSEDFWYESFVAILFHDLGKTSDNFAYLMDCVKSNVVPDFSKLARHEFLSGMYLVNLRPDYIKKPHSLFAVFSHHKSLTSDYFAGQVGMWDIKRTNLEAFFKYVGVRLEEEFPNDIRNQMFNKEQTEKVITFFEKNNELKNFSNLSARAANIVYTKGILNISENERKDYIWHKALLVASDWSASQDKSKRKLEDDLVFDKSILEEKIKEKLIKEKKEDKAKKFAFKKFQIDAYKTGNILAIAPTGSGKTEASLLWASLKDDHSKIIYLLPTRNTSNALFARFNNYFPQTSTALVHSSAKLYRLNEVENTKRQDREKGEISDGSTTYNQLMYLREKSFFKPLTVSTIDQLLTIGFNVGDWELRTFHLYNAKVIIDEVHAYAPYTLGLLIASIRYLKENFNTQFFVMSATMPTRLQNLFKRELAITTENHIADVELLNASRNTIRVEDKNFEEMKPEIIEKINAGKKVLVVMNTVDDVIKVFNELKQVLPEEQAMCYHSRFIVKDRQTKEKKILDNEINCNVKLLISSQVCEMSLDIDYDFLYTENAPIDAIVQRAGRVNRGRNPQKNTEVVIFKHSEMSEKIYDIPDILKRTYEELSEKNGQRLTENDWLSLVDEVYKDWNFEELDSYKDGLNKYNKIQRDSLNYITDYKSDLVDDKIFTREGLDTENIIPLTYLEECKNLVKEKKKYKLEEFSVSIRKRKLWVYLNNWRNTTLDTRPKEEFFEGYRFVEIPYDSDLGITFPEFKKKEERDNTYFD
jgi:CRISPR-associated endonuclease/helicase Cas3